MRQAIDRARWSDALELLDDAGDAARTPELLELRARAAYGNGDFEDSISAWEDLHGISRDTGDTAGAARAAAMVAMFLMIDTGLMAPVRGWLGRAERLLEGDADNPAHAVIAAVRTYERFMCGDLEAALEQSTRAVELGRLHHDIAAEVIGRTAGARVTILQGDMAGGLEQLDEVGALLMSGEVDPLTTGMMLCELICAAQGLALYDMASEWTDAMKRWGHDAAFGGLHGRCRVHRAEMLRVSGPCDAAEDEALSACDELRPWMRREFGWPLAELGNIRLRKGDLEGAEEAFAAAHEHVWCPHPGLALVRLEQGRLPEAQALIDDAIAHPFQTPSKERPPSVELTLAPLFEAQAEIAAALGDAELGTSAADSLRSIADTWDSAWLSASAELAEARMSLTSRDVGTAVGRATSAVRRFAELGAPYETAVARTVLADAHEAAGNDSAARLERTAALSAFESYGAEGRAAQARALLEGSDGAGVPEGSTSGGARARGSGTPNVFRLDGDRRTITFDGSTSSVSDLKGFRYLARMLAEPGREFHVLDLVAVEQGTLPTGSADFVGHADLEGSGGQGLPALDAQAREAYRRRLSEVEEDIDEATRHNDTARLELAERDREFLLAELSRAVGLGGRLRAVGSDSERARTAVARTLRYATDRLEKANPALAAHLRNCLQTGTYCSYCPDPLSRVDWSL